MSRRFTIVSLFSGAMGLDLGLHASNGFRTLACIEKSELARKTICRNRDAGRFGDSSLLVYGENDDTEGDITRISPRRVLRDLGLKPGELDLLIGGPPCQSFSNAGKRGSITDPRGMLLWRFLRYVEVLQPRFFLMENVRGMMAAKLPGGEAGSVITRYFSDIPSSYRIDCFEVNAANYGAPQIRERVLMFGNRYDLQIDFPLPTHGESSGGQQPLFGDLHAFRTLGDVLNSTKAAKQDVLDFSPRKKKYLAMIPAGGNWRTLPDKIARESMGKAYFIKGGRSGWWRRLSLDVPSPTILTMPNHSSTSLCHPTETRALSLQECAAIQEFPPKWRFCGTLAQRYTQVGNAVPIRLGSVAADVLLPLLKSTRAKQQKESSRPPRVVYLNAHVRTRRWFQDGKAVILK